MANLEEHFKYNEVKYHNLSVFTKVTFKLASGANLGPINRLWTLFKRLFHANRSSSFNSKICFRNMVES